MADSFLQTKEWLDFQKHVGRKTWSFDPSTGSANSPQASSGQANKIRANIIKHDLPFGKNYLYVPHGPVVDFPVAFGNAQSASGKFTTGHGPGWESGFRNPIRGFVDYVKRLAKEEKAIFVKIEPLHDIVPELLFAAGIKLKKSNKEIQPKRTVILDLAKSEEELLKAMHHKTRYNIRLAEKHGLEVRESGDVNAFWKLLQQTAKEDRFYSHEKSYYEKLLGFFSENSDIKGLTFKKVKPFIGLYLVWHEQKPIAGAIILTYGDTGYYLHGAMDRRYKSLMAPYLLHWHIMKMLHVTGYMFYDLWGIDAKKWPGVTRFKLCFGGRMVEHPGSFDLPISKFWYFMYKVGRKVFRK